ncbi:MAG: YidC/Oxa1 family membrane protein insertase [Patescibacteria group bacterium]
MWNTIFVQPILNLLVAFYHLLFSNFGLAIIGMTLFVRLLLFPLSLPALRMSKRQQDLKPELDKLREKYKDDKEKLAQAQMEFMRKHNLNPALGCLPQIIQFVFLIALYQVFRRFLSDGGFAIQELNNLLYFDFLRFPSTAQINTRFLYLDLTKPDPYYILPIVSGVLQYGLMKFMRPSKKKDVAEESDNDIMSGMQGQMAFLFPLMTVFIGFKLQSGLVVYWLMGIVVSMLQQLWVSRQSDG